MKRLALLLAVVTVAAACSSSAETANSSQPTANSSATVDSTQPPVDTAQTTLPPDQASTDSIGDDGASLVPAPTIPPDAAPAPDFTMALADGESFTLSEQAMPVYMIFWADW